MRRTGFPGIDICRFEKFPPDLFGGLAGVDLFFQSDRTVAFGQAFAVFPEHQRDVNEAIWRGEFQPVVKPELAWCGVEQVGSAQDFADALIDRAPEVERDVTRLKKTPGDRDLIDDLFRAIHNINGDA